MSHPGRPPNILHERRAWVQMDHTWTPGPDVIRELWICVCFYHREISQHLSCHSVEVIWTNEPNCGLWQETPSRVKVSTEQPLSVLRTPLPTALTRTCGSHSLGNQRVEPGYSWESVHGILDSETKKREHSFQGVKHSLCVWNQVTF